MIQLRKKLVAVVGVVSLLALAGCGSDGDRTDPVAAPPPLTEAQFVKKMNDICFANSQEQEREAAAYLKKRGITGTSRPIKAQEKILIQIELPLVRETIRELEELRPPAKHKATMEAFLREMEKATDISEKEPRWLSDPNSTREPFMRARALAGKMKTYFCGQA